ncbi:MAG: MnmC family methyltransferase [Bdellovibrionaceae bacterium]|nr:MnmC family methyltransferase [Pseudobdellovibrionaceae bacterium]
MVDKDIPSQDEFPFEWITTKDGSFTLKPLQEGSEWMHSLHGAYSESQYIYGEAIRKALTRTEAVALPQPLHIFSLGLGLGYVEWIALLECLRAQVQFQIHTYESEDSLKDLFIQNACHDSLAFSYLTKHLLLDYTPEEISHALNVLKFSFSPDHEDHTKPLCFYPAFPSADVGSTSLNSPACHLILYDAYSSKSQNELWEQKQLEVFLSLQAAEEFCVFATYASTSALKKALKNKGFKLESKKGFANKRESILAVRDLGSLGVI